MSNRYFLLTNNNVQSAAIAPKTIVKFHMRSLQSYNILRLLFFIINKFGLHWLTIMYIFIHLLQIILVNHFVFVLVLGFWYIMLFY